MASAVPAARVEDPFGHSSAMNGVVIGLAVGALIGTAILTGGMSLIAVGAAVAVTGGAGLAGQAIGQTMAGPDTGVITIGSPSVFIEGRPAAMTVLAQGPCSKDSGGPIPVATGSATVRIHAQAAARVGEKMGCSAVIRRGARSVFIGGPSEPVIRPTPEVPVWLENTMLAMAIGGTAIGTLGVGLTYGAGAAVGSLVGGTVGGHLGGQAASAGAAALGYGATGQAIAGVAGGVLGGALGGAGGFRGGHLQDMRVNRATAQAFYGEQGWPQARIDSHLKGIDFSRPVKVVELPANRQMSQWQVPGGPKGNYFAAAKETPGRLGISPVGHDPHAGAVSKVQTHYTSVRPTRALRSNAAPVDDFWSSPYGTAQTPGGGRQFFVPDQDAFQP